MNIVVASLEAMSLVVNFVLIVGNLFGKREKSTKNKMYMISLAFTMMGTLLHMMWNFSGSSTHNMYLGKGMVAATIVCGIIAESYLGFYYISLINGRRRISVTNMLILLSMAVITITYTIWGSHAGKVIYYYYGHIYHGPHFKYLLNMIIVIGIYEIALILMNIKTMGWQDTFITLSYYVLPIISLIIKDRHANYDFIFPSMAISMLIINNLLLAREKSEAVLYKQLAEDAAKNKSEFLANMSHEIRTPINAVLGLNEMILRESKERAIIGYAHDIKSSGTQLLSLVNDVLDFSKIESGKMELVPVNYDFSSLLNDVVNMINTKAQEKKLKFEIDVDSSIPRMMYGDEVRIKQIMTNILSNAVKYTRAGSVTLSVKYEKIEEFAINMTVSVSDTGIGMKPEDIEKLFNPFERIDEKLNRNIEGTGLGMAITKHFLGLMDSHLEVESEYGKGSTFHFTIRQQVENWDPMGDYQTAFEKLRDKAHDYKVMLKAPNAKILIVDDMPMNLTVARGLLKETKVKIDTATSGEEALELCTFNRYDVIYLDHMMPGLDGVQTLKKMRNSSVNLNTKTPVIVLTANAVSGARDEYLDEGFDDYLTKPINPERLEKSLIRFLPEEVIDSVTEIAETGDETDVELPEEAEESTLDKIKAIPFISIEDGIEATGSEETYVMAAEEFTLTIDDTARQIEDAFNAMDVKNYTIYVHGLKSTARLVGDMELSKMALNLEMAGKDNDVETIKNDTEALLTRFRQLQDYLVPVFAKEPVTDDSLPEITADELAEAIEVIKQGIGDFDLDTVSAVIDQLKNYKLPEDFVASYEKMKVYMANVDFDGMSQLFEQ